MSMLDAQQALNPLSYVILELFSKHQFKAFQIQPIENELLFLYVVGLFLISIEVEREKERFSWRNPRLLMKGGR